MPTQPGADDAREDRGGVPRSSLVWLRYPAPQRSGAFYIAGTGLA